MKATSKLGNSLQWPMNSSLTIASILCFFSFIALVLNYLFFSFHGNNYFPLNTPILILILLLISAGCYLHFEHKSQYLPILREIAFFFLVISVITFTTNAVQYTPFTPIDKQIIRLNNFFFFDLQTILSWTAAHPTLKKGLMLIYDSLAYQMILFPLFIIAKQQFELVHEYYYLLLLSALIGFFFYYFLPTLGPASSILSPYFFEDQYATGIKFIEIHQHSYPSTDEGGLIALPSFHVIWAWLCLYLVRRWRLIFILLLPFNLLLSASCILLGWHYPIDLIGSLITLLVCHYFLRLKRQTKGHSKEKGLIPSPPQRSEG